MEIHKIEIVEATTVSEIINQSFQEQVEILQITEQDYPHYVAFEKPVVVVRAIEDGEFICLLKIHRRFPSGQYYLMLTAILNTNNPTNKPPKKVFNGNDISATRIDDKIIKENINAITNIFLSSDLFIFKNPS